MPGKVCVDCRGALYCSEFFVCCPLFPSTEPPDAMNVLCAVSGTFQDDLWQCMEESRCTFDDEELQLAVLRDPRAVTVSAYFHKKKIHPLAEASLPTIDAYFQTHLAITCMWTTVRYVLFAVILAPRSDLFFFEELLMDQVDWHARLFSFFGLNLPFEVISGVAARGETKGSINEHPGGDNASNRTFRDELTADSLQMMDDVLRTWLPAVLLRRFGLHL